MCGSPILGRGGPVGGRTHQGMPEAHVRADVHQPGRADEVKGPDVQAQDLSRSENQGRVPDGIGGREQDQPLSLVGQVTQAR